MRVIPQNNMADSEHTSEPRSELVTEAILEDKLVDIWPEYPCLYDVRSSDFKNRDFQKQPPSDVFDVSVSAKEIARYLRRLTNHLVHYLPCCFLPCST